MIQDLNEFIEHKYFENQSFIYVRFKSRSFIIYKVFFTITFDYSEKKSAAITKFFKSDIKNAYSIAVSLYASNLPEAPPWPASMLQYIRSGSLLVLLLAIFVIRWCFTC